MSLRKVFEGYIFPPHDIALAKREKPTWGNMLIFGAPDSGKTTLALSIAREMEEYYGEDLVNTVVAFRFDDALKHVDDKPIQVLIIDDAPKEQFAKSRSLREMENIIHFLRIRHEIARVNPNCRFVVPIFTTQDLHLLDRAFRNPMVTVFSILNKKN